MRRIGVRLVKGAYWDYETVRAQQNGWAVPVWEIKAESDAAFERQANGLFGPWAIDLLEFFCQANNRNAS